jgi:hypothetical protein
VYKTGKNLSVGAHQAGTNPCFGVSKTVPQPGAQIPSRYYPIAGYATCTNNNKWAWCLDKPCTVEKKIVNGQEKLIANCACTPPPDGTPTTPYIAVPKPGTTPSSDACTGGMISSAPLVGADQITLWLLNHSTGLTPVNPVQVWVVPQSAKAQ